MLVDVHGRPLTVTPTEEAKAATGIGMAMMSYGMPLSSLTNDPRKRMKQAQAIGISNLYIRACERVIGHRFGTVPWHLEDAAENDVTEAPNPAYDPIVRLIERPYSPLPGDPATATPKTRSSLWALTSRHMGLCGISFWYLDQTDALAGTPAQILYVNPARMTPAENDDGALTGWVLDADEWGRGMPLPLSQVLAFRLEQPDEGHYGLGLVESALSRAELLRLTDHHAAGVLASGGRLAGVFSPPAAAGAIPDEQFQQLSKDVRTIAEDPNAARRALILKGPIEFSKTAATMEELDLESIAKLGKEGILDLWGVPDSQLGGSTSSGGLNSGETRKYDEASFWQNAVGPRLRSFWEVVQYELLDRYAAIGLPANLVIEEPEFDDEAPAYAIAAQASSLPLTNDERREMVGREPLEDKELGSAIFMTSTMTRIDVEPEPVVVPPGGLPPEEKARNVPGVDRTRARMTADIQKRVGKVLSRMAEEVGARVERNASLLSAKPNDDTLWWDEAKWQRELAAAIAPAATLAAEATHDKTVALLDRSGKADLRSTVLNRLLAEVGLRVTGITKTTRDKVRRAIRKGLDDGLGAAELGALVAESAAFDEYRGELIARTETNHVLNTAQLETFREFQVTFVEAIDGDDDPTCAARNGQVYSLEEASGISDHPNGTLDWAPLTLTQA